MDCAEEVSLLRRELSRHEGIYDLSFDVLNGRMTVEFDPSRIPASGDADNWTLATTVLLTSRSVALCVCLISPPLPAFGKGIASGVPTTAAK